MTGVLYAFLGTDSGNVNYDGDGTIDRVEFEMFDSAGNLVEDKGEGRAPYDFRGGSASDADGYFFTDLRFTTTFTLEVRVKFNDGTSEFLSAQFTAVPVQLEYSLVTSQSQSRLPAVPLDGSSISGIQYIYLFPEENVEKAVFVFDDGVIERSESKPPYDFRGGSSSAASPWDADAYPPGTYAIRTTVTRLNGDPITFDTTFEIEGIVSPVAPPTDPPTQALEEEACLQISYLPCERVRIVGNYSLDFTTDVPNSIADQNGVGTGFVMVDPAPKPEGPYPDTVPGYDPTRLTVDTATGTLNILATSGQQHKGSNDAMNALGVGLNLPSKLVEIETVLAVPPLASGGWAQAGLWFGAAQEFGKGTAQDNYCKLVLGTRTAGEYLLQFRCDINGASETAITLANVVDTPFPPTVKLRMELNPVDKKITNYVQFEGKGLIKLGTKSDLPLEFFSFDQAGLDPTVKTRSMGGIFASHRKAYEQTFSFHEFHVREYPLPDEDKTGGTDVPLPEGGIEFDKWSFTPEGGERLPTAIAYGPDGRVYVLDLFGTITAVTLDHDSRTVVDQQVITTLRDHEGGVNRLSLGIAIDPFSTPNNVTLWVGHSDGSISAGEVNSGKVTRISNYPALDTATDIIWNLPRAFANHALNDIEFGPDNKLYLAFGGNTGAGSPNSSPSEFSDRPEQPLSAATLVADVFDPSFGGDCGTPLYTFGIPATCSVRVFASGLRNHYDLTFHFNGEIYAADNALGVTGTVPELPPDGTQPCTGLSDLSLNPGEQLDILHRLEEGSYYGHPNPYRNEGVFKDGEFQSTYYQRTVPPLPNFKEPILTLGDNLSGEFRETACHAVLRLWHLSSDYVDKNSKRYHYLPLEQVL